MKLLTKGLVIISLLQVGCEHITKSPDLIMQICPQPTVKWLKEPWSSEDEVMLPSFRAGCIRHYSNSHCPVRITKTQKLSYLVVCKKVK